MIRVGWACPPEIMSGRDKLVSPIYTGMCLPCIGAKRRYISTSWRRWGSSSFCTPLARRTYPWDVRVTLYKLPREPETLRSARHELDDPDSNWARIRDMKSERHKCRFPCSAAFGQFMSTLLGVSVARPSRHDCGQYCPSLVGACMVEGYVHGKFNGESPSVSKFDLSRWLGKMKLLKERPETAGKLRNSILKNSVQKGVWMDSHHKRRQSCGRIRRSL